MFSHVFVGVSDFDRALRFYKPVLASLDIKLRFVDASRPWAGWQSSPEVRPLFLIGRPYDEAAHDPGNGQMVAFLAPTRAHVIGAYDIALVHGGTCEGPPRLRPQYHEHYFGAYVRDPDRNKLCVVCHMPG